MKGLKVLEYKHWFVIIDGIIYWEKPDLLRQKIHMLNNKRGFALITQEEEEPTINQWAFYWGGIIRGECMNSNCFTSFNEKEIHSILFKELRTYKRGRTIKTNSGDEIQIQEDFVEDFNSYSKKQLSKYIEELIPYLSEEYGIITKEKEKYSLKNSHVIQKKK